MLAGIDEAHWPRIRQIAAEVHDIDHRLEEIGRLLTSRGYAVATDQEDLYVGSPMYNVYAWRPPHA